MPANEDTKAFLRTKLDKIHEGISLEDDLLALKALNETLCENGDNQGLKDYVVAQGVFDVLIKNSVERCTAAMSSGIVPNIVETMKSYSSDTSLMISCLRVVTRLLHCLPVESRASIAESVTNISVKTLEACEANKQSGVLFVLACWVMGTSGAPAVELPDELYEQMVQVVWNGVTRHPHDQHAQNIGRRLLHHLVGPEQAKEMIGQSELHHARDSNCSAAA